jgi:hypothetical protein
VNGLSIWLGDHSEALARFLDPDPATNTTVVLYLYPDWMAQSELDPFFPEIRAASHYAGVKVTGRLHVCATIIARLSGTVQGYLDRVHYLAAVESSGRVVDNASAVQWA